MQMEIDINMDHVSTFATCLPSSSKEDDSNFPASLFDLIKLHSSESQKNDDSDSPRSPFNFIQSRNSPSDCVTVDDSDSHPSLLDLISSHKAQTSTSSSNESNFPTSAINVDNNATSLSELTVKHLGLKGTSQTEEFQTLKEYTRSYLISEGNDLFRFRSSPKSSFEKRVEAVSDKLSSCKIDNIAATTRMESRKIDLTIALQNKCKSNSLLSITDQIGGDIVKYAVLAHPLRECYEDVTYLAEAQLPYVGITFSSFGRIIIKKWKRKILRDKYRHIGKRRPYDISKCFKFDIPSPDDAALKKRVQNNSLNES